MSIVTPLTHTSGNIIIKHNDRWRGNYYLKEDLTFTVNKSQSARFYFLKPGDTTIINGDRISLNLGNKTLIINSDDKPQLIDRELSQHETNSFIITNGTENTDPITYETAMFLVSDRHRKTALRYEWNMILSGDSVPIPDSTQYKPQDNPNLANDLYSGISEIQINLFRLYLEKADGPITNITQPANPIPNAVSLVTPSNKISAEFIDGYKGAAIVMLLLVILVLCALVSK